MTDKFIIDNYQIIKHGEILFRPGITLITGSSNNGKSSIFKAYKQIIYNLSGNTYINQNADKCRLSLENDNYKIIYNKTKTKSSYEIITNEGSLSFDKLGVNQIPEIKDLVHIDKNLHYNFWEQLEKPFLINKTNREQFLLLQESPISSNLLNIQENIKSDIKVLKDDLLVKQGSLNVINDNILEEEKILANSDAINNLVDNVSILMGTYNKSVTIKNNLTKLNSIDSELEKIKEIVDIKFESTMEESYNKFASVKEKISNLTSISISIDNINVEYNNTSNNLDIVSNIINNKFKVCPVCGQEIHNN